MMRIRILGFIASVFLSASVVPASASPVSLLSADGTFRVIYDDAQPSILGQSVLAGGGGFINFGVNAAFKGVPDPDGRANGVIFTNFILTLEARFIPEPGFEFTFLHMSIPGQVGYSFPFIPGYIYDESAMVTALGSATSETVLGPTPHLANFPADGQFGGGAYPGIDLGQLFPPPAAGFDVILTQSILLFSDTTFGFQGVEFDLKTTGVTAAVPEPETYAMLLAGLGLLGYAARRRKLKEAATA